MTDYLLVIAMMAIALIAVLIVYVMDDETSAHDVSENEHEQEETRRNDS